MPTVSHSELTFQSGGRPIRMDAYLPETTSPVPAVIALHGAGGNVSGMERYAGRLAGEGFAVYLLRYFDRTGAEPSDLSAIKLSFPLWMKTLWDAVSFVETRLEVDRSRIALLGFSLGAYLSLANSTIDSRVKVVVEFFGGLPKEMRLFMRRLCPVLILHGEADPIVPVSEAHQLRELLEKKKVPCEMKIYPDAGHGFEEEVWRDAAETSLEFLRKHLKS